MTATEPIVVAPLTEVLADLDGRVSTLGDLAAGRPLLVIVAERDCPTSRGAVTALAATGAHQVVVSQGLAAAAADLVEICQPGDVPVLVEPAPHPVSTALAARTLPTLVLIGADGTLVDRAEGWQLQRATDLAAAAGGTAPPHDDVLPDFQPGCQSRSTLDAATTCQLEIDDRALAGGDRLEDLWELGWHDGLPVVPPTRTRVAAMLDGRDPDAVFGTLRPAGATVTAQRLATCAVLAGCEPRAYPLVAAAARAVLDEAFNAHGLTNTTHSSSPWLLVSGPVADAAGLHGGSNLLGPGARGNLTVGRAIRLLLQLTGGGTPGGLDRSTLGGPHKLGACVPERDDSPWEPLRVTLGFPSEVSTVTVMAGESATSVSDHGSTDAAGVAATLALAMANAWSPTWYPIGTTTGLLVCPEHAATLAADGWTKDDLRRAIVERAVTTLGELLATGSGERTPFAPADGEPDQVLAKFLSTGEVLPVVTGGDAGRFSAVIGPWVGFGLGSTAVTEVVDDDAGPTCTATTATTRRIGT